MSDMFLRWGLWILIGVLVFFIIGDAMGEEGSSLTEMVSPAFVFKVGKFGGVLIALGIALKVFEKVKPPPKSRCQTCGRSIAKGDIFCGTHMRDMLEEEDTRRRTMNVKRPDV